MQLSTDLKHLTTEKQLLETISANKNVMVCCGRMGPMCIPVYGSMKELEDEGNHEHVAFFDMAFDSPESKYIRAHELCRDFMGLPFTMYFKDGKAVKATSSIQARDQVEAIIAEYLTK
ncbi:thioredoxin [Myxococcota bacterium]|nr:thioredoxin [Myxococcota bacterium]MBU1535244.1 thioredoxin [Myxococcota bacterium]